MSDISFNDLFGVATEEQQQPQQGQQPQKLPDDPYSGLDVPEEASNLADQFPDGEERLQEASEDVRIGDILGISADQANALLSPSRKTTKGLGKAIIDRFKLEQMTVYLGQLGNEVRKANRKGNTAEAERLMGLYQQISAQLPELQDVEPAYPPGLVGSVRSFGRKMLTGAAGLIGQQYEIMAGRRETERFFEASKEGPLSATYLRFAASHALQHVKGIGEVEAGSAYMDMIQAGVDPRIADVFAQGIGTINNIIEFAQYATFAKLFPGADQVVTKAMGNMARKLLLGPVLKNTALRLTTQLATATTEQLLQEVGQEAVTFFGENWAIEIQNAAKGTKLEKNKDFLDRAKKLVVDFLPGVLALGAIPIGMQAGRAAIGKVVGARERAAVEAVKEVPPAKPVPTAPKPAVLKPSPPEVSKLLAEASEAIRRRPREEGPITIESEVYTPKEVQAMRTQARRMTVEQISQEITGTGKRAIGKAFTAGTKAEKQAARMTKLHNKILDDARKEIQRLAGVIKKANEPAMGVDYQYAEAMRAIADEIDPYFRSERTLYRRRRIMDAIERYPEAAKQIPQSVLDFARKKALNELTMEDLESTVLALNKLEKIGRKKRQLQLRAEKRARQAELGTVVQEIREVSPPVETQGKGIATLKAEARHHLAHGANVWFLRPQRVIDRIGGGKGTFKGQNFDSLWNRAQRITNEQITGKDTRYEAGAKKMRELGVNQRWLGKRHKIGNIRYTNAELLGLYAASKNELSKVAVLLGNDLTEDQLDAFVKRLSPEGRAWADWIIGEYEQNRQRLQEAHISYTNKPFYVEENYTPLRYLDAIYGTMKEEMGRELLERQGLRKAYAEKGFTISRLTKIPKKFRRQVNLDLTGLWFDQVAKQENYIRNARDIRMLQYIVNNKDWTDAVRQRLGTEYVKVAQEWVNRVVDPNYYRSYDAANKVSAALRRNFAMAKLVLNAGTVLKQAPSWALALADVGPRLLSVSIRAPFEAGKMIERMHRLSPQMRHRSIMREMEELKVMDRNLFQKIQKEVGRYGMFPIYAMDKAIVTMVWNGQFEKSLAAGLAEQEAAMEADNMVQRTQPAAAPKDLAQIFASGEGFNWLNMFSNQLNQIWNMISYDIPQRFTGGIRKGNPKQILQAAMGVAGIMMSGTAIWMISKRRLPRKEEDLKEMLTEQFIQSVPLVGRMIVDASHGFEARGGIPITEDASKLFSAVVGKGSWRKRLNKAMEALASIAGIPQVAIQRTVKAVKKGKPIELIGGKAKR